MPKKIKNEDLVNHINEEMKGVRKVSKHIKTAIDVNKDWEILNINEEKNLQEILAKLSGREKVQQEYLRSIC